MASQLSRTLLAVATLGATACGVPVDGALPSHRAGAPVWQTTDIAEQGDRVRITVSTAKPEQARLVALRIINQRRVQGWRVIEVDVHDEHGTRAELIRSTAPHPAATLRDGYANTRDAATQ